MPWREGVEVRVLRSLGSATQRPGHWTRTPVPSLIIGCPTEPGAVDGRTRAAGGRRLRERAVLLLPCGRTGVRALGKSKALPPIQRRGGGYSADRKPVSQLQPPLTGPAVGAKPSTSERRGNEK